jgi:hypothetical protein
LEDETEEVFSGPEPHPQEDNQRIEQRIANEGVRLGFAHAHIIAVNRVFTGIDIWILFKIFIVMPVTVVFFWWQAWLLQKYRQPTAW